MYTVILFVHVLVAIALIVLVLIQHGKGADAGAADGGSGDLVGMGKAGHLARDTAQAKAGISGIVCGLQPTIVEPEGFGRAILEIEFPVIAGFQQLCCQSLGRCGFEIAIPVKEAARVGRVAHRLHIGRPDG